jgi:hypothetical protein
MRRYRLTLSEAQDTSWRSIRYIRPQQKLKEVTIFSSGASTANVNSRIQAAQWPCITPTTICTLRVVIVPFQAELLADTEPVTFTYLYRQVNSTLALFSLTRLSSSRVSTIMFANVPEVKSPSTSPCN